MIPDSVAVPPGESVDDTIYFTPDTTKILYAAQLNIIADDTTLVHVLDIGGYGTTSPMNFSTTAIDFGTGAAGTVHDTIVTVSYPGSDTAKIIVLNRIGDAAMSVISSAPLHGLSQQVRYDPDFMEAR